MNVGGFVDTLKELGRHRGTYPQSPGYCVLTRSRGLWWSFESLVTISTPTVCLKVFESLNILFSLSGDKFHRSGPSKSRVKGLYFYPGSCHSFSLCSFSLSVMKLSNSLLTLIISLTCRNAMIPVELKQYLLDIAVFDRC